jgi:hypothetical protein
MEFDVKLTKKPEISPQYIIEVIEEEPEPEPEPVIEEEPEPEPVVIMEQKEEEVISEPLVEETIPLDEEELEEAKSQAPKKEKDGSVAIGPWRPDW